MSEDPTMRECLMRDIHNLEDQLHFAMGVIKRLERERDEARDLSAALQLKCNMMQAALDDWDNAVKHVEAAHADEVHCGCVPVLRKLLTEARDTVLRLRKHRAIARNFGNQMERERDHWRSESLEQAKLLAMSGDREERLRAKEASK